MNDHYRDNQHSHFDLSASTDDLVMRADDLMQHTKDVSSEGIAALRERLSESLGNARTQVSNVRQYAMKRSKAAAAATDSYVREKPWQVVAMTVLFGVLIGYLGSRSRR